ncbi:MAG: undecaprenyl-phosphate galactose phosphotransferase WbaP [Planctomycetota bacterium]
MASSLESAGTLPVGVISTEAIEQLSPVIPSVQPTRSKQAQQPRGVASNYGQVILTTAPMLCMDLLVVLGGFCGAALLVSGLFELGVGQNTFFQGTVLGAIFLCLGFIMRIYPATGVSPVFELRQLTLAALASFSLLMVSNSLLATLTIREIWVCVFGGLFVVVLLPLARASVRHTMASQGWWGERVVIIGAGMQGQAIYKFYQRAAQRGLRPVGIVDRWSDSDDLTPYVDRNRFRYLGDLDSLADTVRREGVRWAIVAPGGCDGLDAASVMQFCGVVPHVIVLPSQLMIPSLWANPRECAGVMGVHVTDHLQSPLNAFVKRSVDIFGSAIGLMLSSPLFLIAVAWTKWKSPGPAFYGHTRIGLEGRSFKAWKFRTMLPNADQVLDEHLEADPDMRREWMETQKLKKDPRIIRGIGNFLRKTSLDEIPQLWNVLVGEMSLVGPRPIVQSEVERYREMFPFYLRVRPGITGLWQVSGRNDTSYNQRVQLDSYYVCNWSPWLDAYILLRTIRTMVMREGAY